MNRSCWRHMLMESGLCLDRARLLDWVLRRDLRVLAFRFLRLRFSPAVLDNAMRCGEDPMEAGRLFSLAMSHINVGDTYKTTGLARTGLADEVVLRRAKEFDAPTLLEVGVSDGSSSVGLLRAKGLFSRILLTDKHACFYERRIPFGRAFLDADKRPLGFKLLCFYLALPLSRARKAEGWRRMETVNPKLASDFGISAIEPFDMFTDVLDSPVRLIRCANVLNASYFTPEQIRAAVANLMLSLEQGGYLVVSHNNARYARGEAVLALRKKGVGADNGWEVADDVGGHELHPLLAAGEGA